MTKWDQGKWWDADKSDSTESKKRCDHCVTKPELVQSGEGDPKSLKCPVCKGFFDRDGTRFDPQALAAERQAQAQRLATDEEESWESIWGNTRPPGQTYCKDSYCTIRFKGDG